MRCNHINFNKRGTKMILTFNTERPYSATGQIIQAAITKTYHSFGVPTCEVLFFDTARKIGGAMQLDMEFDTFNEKTILDNYDNYRFDEDRTWEAREYFNNSEAFVGLYSAQAATMPTPSK